MPLHTVHTREVWAMGKIPLICSTTFHPGQNCCIILSPGGARQVNLLTHSGMRPPWCAVKGNSSTNNRASKIEVREGKNRHLEKQQELKTFWWVFPNLVPSDSSWQDSNSHRLRCTVATVRTKFVCILVSLAVRFWYIDVYLPGMFVWVCVYLVENWFSVLCLVRLFTKMQYSHD